MLALGTEVVVPGADVVAGNGHVQCVDGELWEWGDDREGRELRKL